MKIAKEALFNLKYIFISILFVSLSTAQLPDYDLDNWVGSNFKENAHPFFRLISLQTTSNIVSSSSSESDILIGFSSSIGVDYKRKNLYNRAGVLPMINGSIGIGSNLRLVGSLTGFSSQKDVVIFSSLGLTFYFGNTKESKSNWKFLFDRGTLEGADDFFLKTIGAKLIRGINSGESRWWYGIGTMFYTAGVHVRYSENEETYRRRLEGKTQYIVVGINKNIGKNYFGEVECRVHSSVLVMSLSFNRAIF